jgi:hypothetical protein
MKKNGDEKKNGRRRAKSTIDTAVLQQHGDDLFLAINRHGMTFLLKRMIISSRQKNLRLVDC